MGKAGRTPNIYGPITSTSFNFRLRHERSTGRGQNIGQVWTSVPEPGSELTPHRQRLDHHGQTLVRIRVGGR